MYRRLYLNCPTERKAIEYFDDINRMLKTTGRDFHVEQRFKSFAPIRANTRCQWLVDGSDYMEAVAYAIKSATEEIYITDWFLSPEIYLKRPALSDEWRFDKMLEKKAVRKKNFLSGDFQVSIDFRMKVCEYLFYYIKKLN
jgi:phospholipase D1/2